MAALARRQYGVVSRRQLLAIGHSPGAIKSRIGCGWLHPLHRGVYAVGHRALVEEAWVAAAVLAFGGRTIASHRTAAVLHGLLEPRPGAVHVTTTTGEGGRHHGAVVHETRRFGDADTARVRGIAASSIGRTLVEVAGGSSSREFLRAFNAADRLERIDPLALAAQLRRGRRGSAALRARLEAYTGQPPTESELEALLLDLVVAHELPAPVPQSSPLPRRAQRVDFCWPRERVVVEVDGRQWHAIQVAWGEDHERDLHLRVAGFTPLRYTWRQVTQAEELVAADLRRALGHPTAAN